MTPALQTRFLAMLPRIKLHARIYFRHVKCGCKKADFIAEVVGLSWKWFLRLVEKGKHPEGFVSVLATFAAKAVHSGRRVCGQLKAKDVLSERAQQLHDFALKPLPISTRTSHEQLYGVPCGQRLHDAYEERLRDNTMTPPDEQAAFRIDWPHWLTTRTERDQRIIERMALNERTKDLSSRFGISPARISQLRRQYHEDWDRFTSPAEV